MKFYLGVHRPNWLWNKDMIDIPLFLSNRTLRLRKSPYPKATSKWSLDSGGFTELNLYGEWRTSESEYIDNTRRYMSELGGIEWASPQDYMCEPWMIEKTGLSIEEHQNRTVENYLSLKSKAPEIPFIPVLQGWSNDDYLKCVQMYEDAGVRLDKQPTVGVGSVCRRQFADDIASVIKELHSLNLSLHGFGVKTRGLNKYGPLLVSADSMAWSYGARLAGKSDLCPNGSNHCGNCAHYAIEWHDKIIASLK